MNTFRLLWAKLQTQQHTRHRSQPQHKKTLSQVLTFYWLIALGVCLFPTLAFSMIPARFVRTPALSPDARQIAFGWRGDIWVVATKGGIARRLTAHKGYDSRPLWSRDGKQIAFASNRHGSADVYVMDATGGTPRRLTYQSQRDFPVAWSVDNKYIYFRSSRHRIHTTRLPLYRIPVTGGIPHLILDVTLADAALSPNGSRLAFTRGSARWWRKRWKGPFHSRLWLYHPLRKSFRQLTPQGYSANAPSWLNQHEIVYRSEQSGTFELWKMDTNTRQQTQLTFADRSWKKRHPGTAIRFPRASYNGQKVVFTRWDRLYVWDVSTQQTTEVVPMVSADRRQSDLVRSIKQQGITEYRVSPNGREVAFVLDGDIFIKKRKDPFIWARKIGSSHWRERHLAWSPDGRKLAFVSDRQDGRNAIYMLQANTRNGRQLLMAETFQFKLTRITPPNLMQTEQQPRWSPQGNALACIRGRGKLLLYQLPQRTERTLVSGWNLQGYSWSPDGRWIAFVRDDKHSNSDIFLVRTKGKHAIFNLSRFPDLDSVPVWSANGRVLAFLSRDVHNRNEIRYVYLRKSDHERSKDERQSDCKQWKKQWVRHIRRQRKAQKQRAKARKQQKTTSQPATTQQHPPQQATSRPTSQPIKPRRQPKATHTQKQRKQKSAFRVLISDLERLPFRFRNVPYVPGFQGAQQLAISPTGCHFYIAAQGRGISGLYRIRFDGQKLKRLAKGPVSHITIRREHSLFYLGKGGRLFVQSKPQDKQPKPLRFKAEVSRHRPTSYMQKFEEGWHLLNDWFYDPTFHGVDWGKIHLKYRKLIAQVTNHFDFDDAVNMMLGELNASHTGVYSVHKGPKDRTADLGITLDLTYKGKGLRIAKVRRRGPAHRRKSRLYPGDILLSIQGHPLSSSTNIHQWLNHKADRYVALQVLRKSQRHLVIIRPVSARRAVLQRYLTWVDSRRALVKKWSGGRLSYAHIRSMNISSLARFERALFAHTHNTKALVIDVRNNGGGWTADMLLTMFFPKPHAFTRWRGSKKGYPVIRRPFYTWHKPSILLCNQRSISNAEIFAHAFKNLKIGTVVGMPTYGGVISTSTIKLLGGTRFRIPLRGWWAMPSNQNMENGPAIPHVIVPHKPSDEVAGHDPQLRRAVQLMLSQLPKK